MKKFKGNLFKQVYDAWGLFPSLKVFAEDFSEAFYMHDLRWQCLYKMEEEGLIFTLVERNAITKTSDGAYFNVFNTNGTIFRINVLCFYFIVRCVSFTAANSFGTCWDVLAKSGTRLKSNIVFGRDEPLSIDVVVFKISTGSYATFLEFWHVVRNDR